MQTCLIVDDNEVNREVASNMVELLGFGVILAESGMAAIEPITEGNVAVILLDWRMPGLDGGDIVDFIRESRVGKRIPIIIYTGETISARLKEIIDNGSVQGLIEKPITMDKLRTEFSKINLI